MKLRNLLGGLADAVYPQECVFCGEKLEPGQRLCLRCTKNIKPSVSEKSIPLSVGNFLNVLAIFSYDDVRKGVLSMKFHSLKKNAETYGEFLSRDSEVKNCLKGIDCITAVPISKKRLKERGFNQSAVMAEKLCDALNIPYVNALRKIRDNYAQSTMDKADRLINTIGVYECVDSSVRNKKIMLMDDIITTGATISSCAEILYKAGAAEVRGLCFAHASEP